MKYALFLLILSLMICAAASEASAVSPLPDQPLLEAPVQWQLNMRAPQVKTEIAALVIQGKRRSERIYIPDMDILITKDGKRLIPLLRFLRIVEARGELTNDMVVFKVEGGQLTPLDLLNKTLQVDDKKVPIDIEVGTSDITNTTEIYVSEEVLKQAFGFDFTWDPERVEYTITTDRELEIFKRRRLKVTPVSLADIQKMSESLPETEPPARPRTRKPLISFFQTESRTDIRKQWPENVNSYLLNELPALNIWGHLFKGDYKIRFRRDLWYPATNLSMLSGWIDRAVWTSKNDSFAVNVGDTNIGLSDLVGPVVNLFGATFKWLPNAAAGREQKDRFFKMTRPSFLPDEKFEGYALLGSDVELHINNRLVESKKPEEFDGAPIGYGYYRFNGIGLFTNSLNDVKIVTKRPDGVIEESRREVLPVDQLLPAGQFACMGALGTRKKDLNQETTLQGNFLGAQALYGATKNLTLGLTAATQDAFSDLMDESSNEYYTSPRLLHLAHEARYRLFNNLFGKYNVAVSRDPGNYRNAFASTASIEYHLKRAKIDAQVFSYDPGYSNGVTSVSDRRGFGLSGNWQVFKNVFLKSAIMHIFNNLNDVLEYTKREDLMTVTAEIGGLVPRSTLRLQAGRLDRLGGDFDTVKGNIYSAELQSSIMDNLETDIYYSFGDRIDGLSTNDLSYGLSVPSMDSFYSYNTRIKASYRIGPSFSISSAYYKSNTQDRIEFSPSFSIGGKHPCRLRFDVGRDLTASKNYLKNNVEFSLDKNGDNRIGLRIGFDETGPRLDVGFYVTIKNMFAFKDGRIDNLAGIRMYPERGGIQGTVYMDLNCNGHRDPGEPGVPNIAILLDDRQCTQTDRDGDFYILRKEDRDLVTVSLDINSLSAIYTPTQGLQRAYWEEGSFTPVNLGVCVLGAVSGTLKVMDKGKFSRNLSGTRVVIMQKGSDMVIKDSVTAYDGSFYIGQVKPGSYIVKIDKDTLPPEYETRVDSARDVIFFQSEKPVEIENSDIYLDLNLKKIEDMKKQAEEAAKQKEAEANKVRTLSGQHKLTAESVSASQEVIADNILGVLQYMSGKLLLPKNSLMGGTQSVNLTI